MTISNSHGSYTDCHAAMDKALEDTKGVRIKMKDFDAATFFRMRLHQARKLDRDRSREIYDPTDAQYGASAYDPLVVRIRVEQGTAYVYIQPVGADLGEIESLSELEAAPEVEEAIPATPARRL